MNNQKGSNIVGGVSIRGREDDDLYTTPTNTTKAILDRVKLDGSILEPASGLGHISEVLKIYYPDSEIVSTDLINRGYGQGNIDFLTYDYERKFSNVITNPPFKHMKEFVEKSLEIATDKVLMFGKIQFLEGKSRREFFKNTPLKYVYVFSERQNPWRNGQSLDEKGKPWSGTVCYAWFVWEHGYEGEPIVRWI